MQITVLNEKDGDKYIKGETSVSGHDEEWDAIAIRDLIQAPSGTISASVSEVFLTRERDIASPKLAQACASGENIGTVTIYLLTNVGGSPQPWMKYTLTETFVSRIEHETLATNGGAYLPHQGFSGMKGSPGGAGLRAEGLNQNAGRLYARARANPIPIFALPVAEATDKEIERVWLSPATIEWRWESFDSDGSSTGHLEKGWNLQSSTELA